MDFNLIKRCNKKVNLWMGAISFSILAIALIIIFVLTRIEIKVRLLIAIQFLINNLLFWLIIMTINLSSMMIGYFFKITTWYNSQTHEIEKKSFSFNQWSHLFIILFCLIIWLIEISGFMFTTHNWIVAFKKYWWVCLILFFFNLIFIYTNFIFEKYLYKNDSKIKNLLLEN